MSSFVIVIFSLLFLSSCAKDSTGSTVTFDATFSGKITDASNGNDLEGATVYIEGYSALTDTTDNTGAYQISNAPAGERVYIRAFKAGYEEGLVIKTGVSGQLTGNSNISLLPEGFGDDKIVIILTWAAAPADLDSHLYIGNAGQTLIDHTAKGDNDGNPNSTPFAGLDVDDTDGNGPETMVVQFKNGSTDFNGTYRYYIHDFGNTGNLSSSQAVVTVYIDGAYENSFEVPSSGSQNFWHVFDFDSSGALTIVNQLKTTEPTAP
jgi:hypothetical protein